MTLDWLPSKLLSLVSFISAFHVIVCRYNCPVSCQTESFETHWWWFSVHCEFQITPTENAIMLFCNSWCLLWEIIYVQNTFTAKFHKFIITSFFAIKCLSSHHYSCHLEVHGQMQTWNQKVHFVKQDCHFVNKGRTTWKRPMLPPESVSSITHKSAAPNRSCSVIFLLIHIRTFF